jgi:hypothetical protein
VPSSHSIPFVRRINIHDQQSPCNATAQTAQVPEHGRGDHVGVIKQQHAGCAIGGRAQSRSRRTLAQSFDIRLGVGSKERSNNVRQIGRV